MKTPVCDATTHRSPACKISDPARKPTSQTNSDHFLIRDVETTSVCLDAWTFDARRDGVRAEKSPRSAENVSPSGGIFVHSFIHAPSARLRIAARRARVIALVVT